jgi:protein-tyrosine phosphatase
MNLQGRPFDRCYWVSEGRLLAGCYPGDLDDARARTKQDALLRAGVRVVINLTEDGESGRYGLALEDYAEPMRVLASRHGLEVAFLRHPIRDMDVPTVARMVAVLDAVDTALRKGTPVYVHCWGGYGRTGTVVGCWLNRHGRATGAGALRAIDDLRTGMPGESPQTDAQRRMIEAWPRGQ